MVARLNAMLCIRVADVFDAFVLEMRVFRGHKPCATTFRRDLYRVVLACANNCVAVLVAVLTSVFPSRKQAIQNLPEQDARMRDEKCEGILFMHSLVEGTQFDPLLSSLTRRRLDELYRAVDSYLG